MISNMQQGEIWQLYPLVNMIEALNRSGCNYSLDIMIFSEEKVLSYYDLRTDGTQVKGTLYNSNGVESGVGVPYLQLDVDVAVDMVLEFEHFLNIVDQQGEPGIRCNFHRVSNGDHRRPLPSPCSQV